MAERRQNSGRRTDLAATIGHCGSGRRGTWTDERAPAWTNSSQSSIQGLQQRPPTPKNCRRPSRIQADGDRKRHPDRKLPSETGRGYRTTQVQESAARTAGQRSSPLSTVCSHQPTFRPQTGSRSMNASLMLTRSSTGANTLRARCDLFGMVWAGL